MESKLSKVIADYQKSKKEGTLLCLPFITIFQYLFYLKEISILLGVMGSRAMVYLAAAVADFYVSYASMVRAVLQFNNVMADIFFLMKYFFIEIVSI